MIVIDPLIGLLTKASAKTEAVHPVYSFGLILLPFIRVVI